jgi:hypothetical protein
VAATLSDVCVESAQSTLGSPTVTATAHRVNGDAFRADTVNRLVLTMGPHVEWVWLVMRVKEWQEDGHVVAELSGPPEVKTYGSV